MPNSQSSVLSPALLPLGLVLSSVLKPGTESRGCKLRARPDCRQLTALRKVKENLYRLPSPAKTRISQYKPWRLNWNLLLQRRQGMHWGKELEIVQEQETLLLLGKGSTTNTKNIHLNLRLSGKVIKKGCFAFLLNDVMCSIRTLLLL